MVMREVTNQPMTECTCSDACTDSPEDKRPTTYRVQKQGRWYLLKSPGPLKEPEKSVIRYSGIKLVSWWRIQYQVAMKLPPSIHEDALSVPKVGMAIRLALGEVAQIMLTH
jgi:hypothetical protein